MNRVLFIYHLLLNILHSIFQINRFILIAYIVAESIQRNMDYLKHIEYCPPNVTIHDIWINHGLSHCFLDTVSSSVLATFIIIFGSIQLILYRRYSTPIEDLSQISTSKLYYLQMFLLTVIPSLSILRFVLESFVFPDAHLYGYTVSLNSFLFQFKQFLAAVLIKNFFFHNFRL